MMKSMLMICAAAAVGFFVVYGTSDLGASQTGWNSALEPPPVVVEFVINPGAPDLEGPEEVPVHAEAVGSTPANLPARLSIAETEPQSAPQNIPVDRPEAGTMIELSPSVLLIF